MTQIFVAVPLRTLEERIDSSVVIKTLLQKIDQSMRIDNILWTQINSKKPHPNLEDSLPNKCIIQLSQPHPQNYLEAVHKSLQNQRLQNSLTNIKQDLCELMKSYQNLKRENQKLFKKLAGQEKEKQNSGFCKILNEKNEPNNSKQISLGEKQKSVRAEEPLSMSLEVNSKIACDKQKSQSFINDKSSLKSTVAQFEKQISQLTRQNLQLKNTIIYYESRLQFVGEYLKKMEEEKEREKAEAKNLKKQRK